MIFEEEDMSEEVTELIRDVPPAHYSFKVHSFSLLSKNSIEKYESCVFSVGGHKWKLILYPSGDPSRKVNDHISLYLAYADASSLPTGWEVNISYRFTIFDQIRDRYLTIGDVGGRVRRFHGLRTKLGFPKLISLQRFTAETEGFIMDDTCEFGVEVFIYGSTAGGERLRMLDSPTTDTYSWKVENFSRLYKESYFSEVFSVGDHEWKIELYPQGNDKGRNNSLSLYLYLAHPLLSDTKLYTTFKLRIRNQKEEKHIEEKDHYWFKSPTDGWGWEKFISLEELKDSKKGFLLKDTCIIEAEVTVLGLRRKD